eukprot:220359-Alexandrium_andersonii.AAC.1
MVLQDAGTPSSFMIIKALRAEGWRWARLPKSVRARAALVYTRGGQKLWYTLSIVVDTRYLLCLKDSEALFNAGLDFVPH